MRSRFNRRTLGSALAGVALGATLLTGSALAAEPGEEHASDQRHTAETHATDGSHDHAARHQDGHDHAGHAHEGTKHADHDRARPSAARSAFGPFGRSW